MENTNDFFKGPIPTIILNVLSSGDKYGYEIIKEAEEKSNGKIIIKQPSLYSCLKRLESQKLISSYWMDSDIGGKRHYYRISDMGKKQLEYNQETLLQTTSNISALSTNIKEQKVDNNEFKPKDEDTIENKLKNEELIKNIKDNETITKNNQKIEEQLNNNQENEENIEVLSSNFFTTNTTTLLDNLDFDKDKLDSISQEVKNDSNITSNDNVLQEKLFENNNKFEEIKNENYFTEKLERDQTIEKAKNKLFSNEMNNEKEIIKEDKNELNFENKAFLQCKLFDNTQNLNVSNLKTENEKITLNFEDKQELSSSYNEAKNNLFNNKSFFEYEKNIKLEDNKLLNSQELNSNLYNKINVQNSIISDEKIASKDEMLNNINNLIKNNESFSNIEINNDNTVNDTKKDILFNQTGFVGNDINSLNDNKDTNEIKLEENKKSQESKSFADSSSNDSPISFITDTITYVPKVKKLETPSLDLINNSSVNFKSNKNNTTKYFKGYYDKFDQKEEPTNKEIKVEVDKEIIMPIKNKENGKNSIKPQKIKKSKIKLNTSLFNIFKVQRSNLINYYLYNVFTFLFISILATLESLTIYLVLKNNHLLNSNQNFLFILLPIFFIVGLIISLILYTCKSKKYLIKEDIKKTKNSTLILIFMLLIIIYFGISLSLGLNGNNIKDFLTILILPSVLSLNILLLNPIKFLVTKIKLVYKPIN